MLNLQEEVFCISEAVSGSLDHFDLIIHTFEHTGIERIFGRGEYASEVRFEFPCEVQQRFQSRLTTQAPPVAPLLKGFPWS